LLALEQAGAEALCFAPDIEQDHVTDHVNGNPIPGKTRNVLTESARIARGKIQPLSKAAGTDLDALIFPGGFGAALNLCSFAHDGPECNVLPDVKRLVGEMIDAGKPAGFICIAPVIAAQVYGARGLQPTLTIGTDEATAKAIEAMGGIHRDCLATETVVDEANRLVSTPAYMLASGPAEVYAGIGKLVREVLRLAGA
jgi:enhancing lycopene biosynthesis protein 2